MQTTKELASTDYSFPANYGFTVVTEFLAWTKDREGMESLLSVNRVSRTNQLLNMQSLEQAAVNNYMDSEGLQPQYLCKYMTRDFSYYIFINWASECFATKVHCT